MATFETTYRPTRKQIGVNPVKFTLWLFMVTVVMLFAAFTSSLIVGKPDAIANGTWFEFNVPFNFTFSTIAIVLSSISMQWAFIAAKRNDVTQNRIALLITLTLGIVFIFSQVAGYKALMAENIYVTGMVKVGDKLVSPVSGSFFYVITFIHGLHVLGGILFLAATLYSSLKFRVHSKNLLRINLCTTYWHFIGVLWVYLFALLNIYR